MCLNTKGSTIAIAITGKLPRSKKRRRKKKHRRRFTMLSLLFSLLRFWSFWYKRLINRCMQTTLDHVFFYFVIIRSSMKIHFTIYLVKMYTASFVHHPTGRVKGRIKRRTESCSNALNWSWPRVSSPPNSEQRADKLEADDCYQVWVLELLTSNVKDVP